MGRFFSNIQIKNNQESQKQFIELLNNAMKKRELIPASEDDASLTYILAFSENNEWITLCSADYESGGEDVKEDVQFLAESLKTCCISTSVVDSDCAILEMYNTTSAMADMVLVGDGSGYGFEDGTEFKGKKEAWEPYLKNGSTWEQLSELWEKDFTFAEDALSEMAQLLGMDERNITADFDEFDSDTENNPNIFTLYFKKANKKSLTLNAAFIQLFGEALEPLGFKKIKGKQPYFVRVVPGGEIIHVITYRNEDADHMSEKSFNILGGVATVYRDKIDLTIKPYDNKEWLERNFLLYQRLGINRGNEFQESILKFSYKSDSEESMLAELKRSLDATKQAMVPFLDQISDIDACIRHFLRIGRITFNEYFEGFLYLKTDNYSEIILENLNRKRAIYEHNVKMKIHGYTQEELERRRQRYEEVNKRVIAPIEEILTNPELYAEYTEKLERRKAANTETLRSYGLDI